MVRQVYIFLFVIFLITAFSSAAEHRGMWVVRYTLDDSTACQQLIPMAQQLHLTDLYIQVRALGKNYGLQNGEEVNPDTSKRLQRFKKIVQQAHNAGIRVHAWLNVFYIHSDYRNHIGPGHLFATERKYLLRKATDNEVPNKVELTQDGVEGHYIDPLNSKNITIIEQLVNHLTDSLGVDGIHLDYFRYPQAGYIYSPAGRTLFMQKNYTDPVAFLYQDSNTTFSQRKYITETYGQYLNQNITAVLKRLRRLTSQNPKVVLSVAVKPDWQQAREKYYQDWSQWLKKNLCDFVLLMNYNKSDSVFDKNMDKAEQLGNSKKIIIGIGSFNIQQRPFEQRLEKITGS